MTLNTLSQNVKIFVLNVNILTVIIFRDRVSTMGLTIRRTMVVRSLKRRWGAKWVSHRVHHVVWSLGKKSLPLYRTIHPLHVTTKPLTHRLPTPKTPTFYGQNKPWHANKDRHPTAVPGGIFVFTSSTRCCWYCSHVSSSPQNFVRGDHRTGSNTVKLGWKNISGNWWEPIDSQQIFQEKTAVRPRSLTSPLLRNQYVKRNILSVRAKKTGFTHPPVASSVREGRQPICCYRRHLAIRFLHPN